MLGYKNRIVEQGKSKVYFNLHKLVFSVQQKGLVVLHTEAVKLTDVKFQVRESGRQKVLQEKKKNVHAFVNGTFEGTDTGADTSGYREATYNPYKYSSFVDKETQQPLQKANEVILINKKIWYK